MSNTRKLAVVAGNGLSISFTENLKLDRITSELTENLDHATNGNESATAAMRSIADMFEHDHQEGDTASEDFERLVGAFESQAVIIDELEDLVSLAPTNDENLVKSIKATADFSRRVRDIGTRVVLKTILENSEVEEDQTKSMEDFFESIANAFGGTISFGNLNYDPLVLKMMLRLRLPFCDLGDGRSLNLVGIYRKTSDGKREQVGSHQTYELRDSVNFPRTKSMRIRLIHLHGSVTYWKKRSDSKVSKFPLEALRFGNLLKIDGVNFDRWEPSVVLANTFEKPRRVQEYPFRVGYDALTAGLKNSDHWLIVGYSFRDESINDMLRRTFTEKVVKPTILVSTYGEELKSETIRSCFPTDEADPNWLLVDRDGAMKLPKTETWQEFIKSLP